MKNCVARVASHIPDRGRVTLRYSGLYANAQRGKIRKASLEAKCGGMMIGGLPFNLTSRSSWIYHLRPWVGA
jgi:hypothetical protein